MTSLAKCEICGRDGIVWSIGSVMLHTTIRLCTEHSETFAAMVEGLALRGRPRQMAPEGKRDRGYEPIDPKEYFIDDDTPSGPVKAFQAIDPEVYYI